MKGLNHLELRGCRVQIMETGLDSIVSSLTMEIGTLRTYEVAKFKYTCSEGEA